MLEYELKHYNAQMAFQNSMEQHGICFRFITKLDGADSVIFEYEKHPANGRGQVSLVCKNAFTENAKIAADAVDDIKYAVRNMQRMKKRDNALAKHGLTYENPPAWASLVHPLAVAFAKHDGLNPLDLVRTLDDTPTRNGLRTAITGGSDRYGRLKREGDLQGMVGTYLRRNSARKATYSDRGGFSLIHLQDALPHTVLTALIGQPISALVEGKAFEEIDIKITGFTQNDEGRQFVSLLTPPIPIAKPPKNTDVSWLEFEYSRSMQRYAEQCLKAFQE